MSYSVNLLIKLTASNFGVPTAQGYRNDWRGTYKNSPNPLPAASYYYVVELNTGEEPITGWMYITY